MSEHDAKSLEPAVTDHSRSNVPPKSMSSQNPIVVGDAVDDSSSPPEDIKDDLAFQKDYRFWMILVTLAFCVLLSSLEGTVVITSLPAIVSELKLGSNYIWVTNVFLLTSAAVQPLFGQFCDLFGRKSVLMVVLGAYILGSGICGGAKNEAMLIGGRTIQGVGSGGLVMAAEVIIADLVPLRHRGNYVSMLLVVSTVGNAIGPFVGGVIVENTTWRWVFYLNLPIGGIAMVFCYLFLNLRYDREQAILEKLKKIDYIGNAMLMASSVSVLIALTWAGPVYAWTDARVLAPLIIGIFGFIAFGIFEASGIPEQPVVPMRLFPNRTSIIIYINTFLMNVVIFWCFFFLPLYFQAVTLSTPSWAGVQLLPITLIAVPGAAGAALLLSKFGKYKILHITGLALITIGVPILAVLKRDSPTKVWAPIQIFPALGAGLLISTLLPSFQASVAEKDQAAATGSWSFIRTFGMVWGIAVAGTVMNSYTKKFAYLVDDPAVREILSGGDAYASATRAFVLQFPEPIQSQIREVFLRALSRDFAISAAFGGTALLLALFEKDIPLRTTLDTEYGLEERRKQTDEAA